MAIYKIKLASDMIYVVDTDARKMWAEEFPEGKVDLLDQLDPTHVSFGAEVVEGPEGS